MLRITTCAISIALAAATAARADVLVLDSCVQQCTDDDLRAFRALRAELTGPQARAGLVAEPGAVLDHLGAGTPLPALANPSLTADALTDALKAGLDDYTSGRYDQAAEHLAAALADAAANPALVVSDPTLRNLVPRAIVGRAVSLQRLADAKQRDADATKPRDAAARDALTADANHLADAALSAMAELARMTPSPSILDSRGPEADRIYQSALAGLAARGRGSLVIHVDDASALLYVDESGEPHQSFYSADVLPGAYRVLVRDPRGRARRYAIDVAPRQQALLDIRWSRDAELELVSAQQARVGFTYASELERADEPAYVRHVAQLARAGAIVVVGRARWRGRPALIAVAYDARGEILRAGAAPLADLATAVRELATFLESPRDATPHVERLAAPPWLPARAAAAATGDPDVVPYAIGWAAGGAATVAGAVIASATDRTAAGIVTAGLGVGVVAVVTGLYLERADDGAVATTATAAAAAAARATASMIAASSSPGFCAGVGWRF